MRLAYVSPLPPQKSGIADYGADLLPELTRFYDIEAIVTSDLAEAGAGGLDVALRTPDWFDAHAGEYDRILYHFGGSPLHRHMPGLLARHPGIVVLHDFFLGELFGAAKDGNESLLQRACLDDARRARNLRPLERALLDRALGVIAHSHFCLRLADEHYGSGTSSRWRRIPIPKPMPRETDRAAARRRLGVSADESIVASFGFIVPFKCCEKLIGAWMRASSVQDRPCRLVLVGECNLPDYRQALQNMIGRSGQAGRIAITGFVDRASYCDWLAATDIAVQLRLGSRGETSAAILDCLSRGIPTIVNAHGSAAELPEDCVLKLPEAFTEIALRDAIVRLRRDAALARRLSEAAIRHIRASHAPDRIAGLYRDAIEHFAAAPAPGNDDFAAAAAHAHAAGEA